MVKRKEPVILKGTGSLLKDQKFISSALGPKLLGAGIFSRHRKNIFLE
jgi:hypothetical protein